MDKITKLEIGIILIMLLAFGIYFFPSIFGDKIKMKNAKVVANASIFTSKSLSYFNADKNAKASDVAKKTAEELNTLSVNPYDKKLPAFVFSEPKVGSILVTSEDAIQTITITGLDADKKIIVRTLIKPPSFVTYQKEELKKDEK